MSALTYQDSIVAVGSLLRPKANEPRVLSLAVIKRGEFDGEEIVRRVLPDRQP